MTSIEYLTIETADPAAARDFYATAFGPDCNVRVRASEAPSTGFRGFTISLIAAQPANVDALLQAAVEAGASVLKPAQKSLWGYGGVVQAPDGTIWQLVTDKKKNSEPASRQIDEVVLLLGVDDVKESKRFYVEHGLGVKKSFGSKYVEFDGTSGQVKLALYKRRSAAKVAGVDAEGTGSHRLTVGSDAEPFTDPDGFGWENATNEDRSCAN